MPPCRASLLPFCLEGLMGETTAELKSQDNSTKCFKGHISPESKISKKILFSTKDGDP